MLRVGYRLLQGWRRLTGRGSAVDWTVVRDVLHPSALILFERLSSGDQSHSYSVLVRLNQLGPVSPNLAQAALLHDVGKSGARLSLFYRSWVVLLGKLAPSILARLSQPTRQGWRYPFFRHAQHAAVGAQLAREAGCSERVIGLIGRHDLRGAIFTSTIPDVELEALQASDEKC